ncbi:MAG: hypothetical protein ABJF11_20605, partial [Reichenbachiella sp.]|uniref:hypothetical protein n=1 Tax=Reichenbachiella sp. TaxID=2184521 RepID=UPI003264A863
IFIYVKHNMEMITHHSISTNINRKDAGKEYQTVLHPTPPMLITSSVYWIFTTQKSTANAS